MFLGSLKLILMKRSNDTEIFAIHGITTSTWEEINRRCLTKKLQICSKVLEVQTYPFISSNDHLAVRKIRLDLENTRVKELQGICTIIYKNIRGRHSKGFIMSRTFFCRSLGVFVHLVLSRKFSSNFWDFTYWLRLIPCFQKTLSLLYRYYLRACKKYRFSAHSTTM